MAGQPNNYYSSIFNGNQSIPVFPYIWDTTFVNTGVTPPFTGVWRPQTPGDFANIELTGVNVSVGAVAITGSPVVTVNRSGVFNAFITGFTTGQLVISPPWKSVSVLITGGTPYINGVNVNSQSSINYGGYDSFIGDNPIVIGVTGTNLIVTWEA